MPGLQVMLFSLRSTGTRVPTVVMATNTLSEHSLKKIKSTKGVILQVVPEIANPNEAVHVEGWVNSG